MPEVQFTHEGIPPLPDGPELPVPPPAFTPPQMVPPQMQFMSSNMMPTAANGIPQFEIVPVRMADGTFKNVEFVSILTPGDPKSIPRAKVTDHLRNLYRPYYEMFRKGLQVSTVGTPLEMWPILTPAQVHQLKSINIFTVEQLRDVSDVNLNMFPMGLVLRNQARDWLASKKDADVLAQRTAEVDNLRAGMGVMQHELLEMRKQLASLQQGGSAPAVGHSHMLDVAQPLPPGAPVSLDDDQGLGGAVPAPTSTPSARRNNRS